MEAKLLAGSTGYDVVIQAGQTLATFRQGRVLPDVGQGKACRLANLDPAIMKVVEG